MLRMKRSKIRHGRLDRCKFGASSSSSQVARSLVHHRCIACAAAARTKNRQFRTPPKRAPALGPTALSPEAAADKASKDNGARDREAAADIGRLGAQWPMAPWATKRRRRGEPRRSNNVSAMALHPSGTNSAACVDEGHGPFLERRRVSGDTLQAGGKNNMDSSRAWCSAGESVALYTVHMEPITHAPRKLAHQRP